MTISTSPVRFSGSGRARKAVTAALTAITTPLVGLGVFVSSAQASPVSDPGTGSLDSFSYSDPSSDDTGASAFSLDEKKDKIKKKLNTPIALSTDSEGPHQQEIDSSDPAPTDGKIIMKGEWMDPAPAPAPDPNGPVISKSGGPIGKAPLPPNITAELAKLEVLTDGNVPERELLARAKFNQSSTGIKSKAGFGLYDMDLIQQYLPHRRFQGSPSEIRLLDIQVMILAISLDVKYTDKNLDDAINSPPGQEGHLVDADMSTRVLIASSIFNVTRNRPDLRDQLLYHRPGGHLRFIIANSAGAGVTDGNNRIALNSSFLSDRNAIIHEFAHLLVSKKAGLEGVPDGLSLDQQQTFKDARADLFKRFHRHGEIPGYLRFWKRR